ncbi:MAG: amino acid permease [Pseudomonadota bacterium]
MTTASPPHRFGFTAATSVVIANMIGTGVFTSLGFQLVGIRSGFALLSLWAIGGLIAFCGAVCYAELGARFPRSGGEYNFLTSVFHPAAGFISGWVSATVGFAAPTALAAMTFAAYAGASLPWLGESAGMRRALACGLILLLAAMHSRSHRQSGATQTAFTLLKLGVIVGFCAVALAAGDAGSPLRFAPAAEDAGIMTGAAFAVSLIYVSYAYTGWNAATYLTGELRDPQRTLPRVLLIGTVTVACLYVALNYAFLRSAPVEAMVGEIEIGFVAARYLLGDGAASATGLVLAALLISTVSAMTMAGPRVLQVMGEDFRLFRWLAGKSRDGVPARAVTSQALLACVFVLTATFESVLVFSGFILALNSFVTVCALFAARHRDLGKPPSFRATLYPLSPLTYLALNGGVLVWVAIGRPAEALAVAAVIAAGAVAYWLTRRWDRNTAR